MTINTKIRLMQRPLRGEVLNYQAEFTISKVTSYSSPRPQRVCEGR